MRALSPNRAVGRLLIALAAGVAAFLLVPRDSLPWWVRAVVGWDTASATLLALAWNIILRADAVETERRCSVDDPGRKVVFLIALLASLFSFFAGAVVLHHVKALSGETKLVWTTLSLLAIALSWFLTHTAYTLRYAHLHYAAPERHRLRFPGDDAPTDLDFAYFAFTIGMCFQVSDVAIASTAIRRAALGHALISFLYNTAIVALALNLALSLL